MANTVLKLFCLVHGDAAFQSFSVEIDSSKTVDDLKQLIRTKDARFESVYAKDLTLLAVTLPVTEEEDRPIVLDGITQKKLFPLNRLANVFTAVPEGSVHVVIQIPAASNAATTVGSVQSLRLKTASSKKQAAYKGLSVESSCRKYLDALAQKLQNLYDFRTIYANATMGDVLHVRKSGEWDRRRVRGQFVVAVGLNDLFTEEQWKELEELNRETTSRIHNGLLASDNGKPYIVIPHAKHTTERTKMLKDIAATCGIVFEADDLVVKDEDILSGSSGSESNCPV